MLSWLVVPDIGSDEVRFRRLLWQSGKWSFRSIFRPKHVPTKIAQQRGSRVRRCAARACRRWRRSGGSLDMHMGLVLVVLVVSMGVMWRAGGLCRDARGGRARGSGDRSPWGCVAWLSHVGGMCGRREMGRRYGGGRLLHAGAYGAWRSSMMAASGRTRHLATLQAELAVPGEGQPSGLVGFDVARPISLHRAGETTFRPHMGVRRRELPAKLPVRAGGMTRRDRLRTRHRSWAEQSSRWRLRRV